jgi:rhamnosyltransferase
VLLSSRRTAHQTRGPAEGERFADNAAHFVDMASFRVNDFSGQAQGGFDHAVVIPLYGNLPSHLVDQVRAYLCAGLRVVLVQNNPEVNPASVWDLQDFQDCELRVSIIHNRNLGGVAGGFNRGIELALLQGVKWITLLDQDSRLSVEAIIRLREPWLRYSGKRLLVGPLIWDRRREQIHGRRESTKMHGYLQTRLLISSGTTFQATDWAQLGPMLEWLVVDYVDHLWSFSAQAKGFLLLQHPEVILLQNFGHCHPHPICRRIGMELYPPVRHFYSLRNLRLLLCCRYVPMDLRLKEAMKMLIKPWLWLLFEPQKKENLLAVISALRAQIPFELAELQDSAGHFQPPVSR